MCLGALRAHKGVVVEEGVVVTLWVGVDGGWSWMGDDRGGRGWSRRRRVVVDGGWS